MSQPIRGKVAKILNARELLINRGSEDGVHEGMRFAVLDPQAENVKDPETGEVLGSIFRPKVTVQISQVEPHLSLAETYRKTTVNTGGSSALGGTLSKMFEPPNYVERFETLKSSEATWEALPESESFVKTGDPVVQVVTTSSTGTGLAAANVSRANDGHDDEEVGGDEERLEADNNNEPALAGQANDAAETITEKKQFDF
jgi:hypothetical protein